MNYYNEHDKKAAAWLRALISEGLIPPGDVDERDIQNVRATELAGYTQCHFFAGVSGWSLALQIAGWPADRPVWTGSCPCQPFSSAGKGLGDKDERHLWPAFFNLIKECRPECVFGEQVASAIGKGWLDGISADLESEGYACGAVVLGAHSVGAPHIRQRLYWVADAESERQHGGARTAQTPQQQERNESGSVRSNDGMADAKPQHDWSGASGSGRRVEPENGGEAGGVANAIRERGCGGDGEWQHANDALASSPADWQRSQWHLCRDGKLRRIPVESSLLGLADGLPEGVDFGWLESGFPLAGKVEGRTTLLKGYGNAIVPQAAAEFISAYLETR